MIRTTKSKFFLFFPVSVAAIFVISACAKAGQGTAPNLTLPVFGLCADGGASDTHPENTLPAIREAVLLGVQMIALNVASTSDGHLVLLRDATVDRTTTGTGKVSELTFEQIRELDAGKWKSEKFKGTLIPTLSEAFEALPHNIRVLLRVRDGAIGATEEFVRESERGDQTTIIGAAKGSPPFSDAEKLRDAVVNGVRYPRVTKLKEMLAVTDDLGIQRVTPAFRRVTTEHPAHAHFKDGEAQEVDAFKDADLWIHHDLWVETDFDSDGDGKPDRMHVSVSRQRQTDTEGLKVPVVYVSSPYFSGTASGNRNFFWDPRHELNSEPPEHDPPPKIELQRRRLVISKSHWKDWIPRGFAVIHSASPGTGLSQGCPTIGADNESFGPKAVVDWLCGRAKGFTTPKGNNEVFAYWSTGKVGMTGTSYNGTIPLATATTGVAGLEAIIPVAPNTSYYHYYRSNGLVRHPGGFIGEDVDVLYNFINSGRPENRDYCNGNVRDREMAEGFDRESGDYNDFWAGRDYLNDMEPMKCALLMAHAFNDWNVMPEHSVRIYEAAKQKGLPVQCYFHQGGHGGPPPLKMMNRWFTRYLYGIENDVEKDPRAWIVREHVDRKKPTPYGDYPHPKSEVVTLKLKGDGAGRGHLGLAGDVETGTQTISDDYNIPASDLAQAETSPNRLLFVTPKLKSPVHISGTCRLKTRIACDKPGCNFSVYLVSLPWNKDSKAKVYDNIITRGWADPQNHESLREGQPLIPGEYYDMSFDLQPDDHVIPAGQQIGLMIFSSDRDHTLWPDPGTKVTVDVDQTTLSVPFVGGESAFGTSLD